MSQRMRNSLRSLARVEAGRLAVGLSYAAVLALLAILLADPSAAADELRDYPRLFGTTETRSANIKPFPKWTDMLSRHFAEERRGDPACTPTRLNRCSVADWLAFLDA